MDSSRENIKSSEIGRKFSSRNSFWYLIVEYFLLKYLSRSVLPSLIKRRHSLSSWCCFYKYYNYIHMPHPWWRSYMLRYAKYITTLLLLLLYDATTYHTILILNTYMPSNNLTILYTVYTTIVGLQVPWITRTCFQGPLKNAATFATPTPITKFVF